MFRTISTTLEHLTHGLLLFAIVALTACGGGSGSGPSPSPGGVDDSPDTTPPTAIINFPPPQSVTEGSSITVRGSASDTGGSGLSVVRVNGLDVTTSDNFANWEVAVPVVGTTTLTVATTDIASNSNMAAATATITRQQVNFFTPSASVVDSANNRALVVDSFLGAVVAVDLSTGLRTILSDSSTPTADNSFSAPEGITLDSANNRALVLDFVRARSCQMTARRLRTIRLVVQEVSRLTARITAPWWWTVS